MKQRRTSRLKPIVPPCRRPYLAVFHSARAVLFRDGVREKSHYCIGLYLQSYVENDELEEDWPMLFDRMRSIRHTDQYSFQAKPSE
jgi:uncharacterized protein (UPF0332 family)